MLTNWEWMIIFGGKFITFFGGEVATFGDPLSLKVGLCTRNFGMVRTPPLLNWNIQDISIWHVYFLWESLHCLKLDFVRLFKPDPIAQSFIVSGTKICAINSHFMFCRDPFCLQQSNNVDMGPFPASPLCAVFFTPWNTSIEDASSSSK